MPNKQMRRVARTLRQEKGYNAWLPATETPYK